MSRLTRSLVEPGLALLPDRLDTIEARVMLYAIGLQESRFAVRDQITSGKPILGPALGFWQFERGGGVKGVLTHPSSRSASLRIAQARVGSTLHARVWEALATDDALACVFARLLLLTDPAPLPRLGDAAGAWDYYVRNWRPGKPHPSTWTALYAEALAFAQANPKEPQ